MPARVVRKIPDLSPSDLENLTFDLLKAIGMHTLIWRTPGADGGRDIEGYIDVEDVSGSYIRQKWYIECKRYAASIAWPVLYHKIAHADAHDADFLLLSTNSNPSPDCENEIKLWNSRRKDVKIRVWRGYELGSILSAYPKVAAKHGLLAVVEHEAGALEPLITALANTVQAASTTSALGGDPAPPLDAASAIAELLSLRAQDLSDHGRLVSESSAKGPPEYDWLTWQGDFAAWPEAGLRAMLAVIKHASASTGLTVVAAGGSTTVSLQGARLGITPAVLKMLSDIALWADIEIDLPAGFEAPIVLSIRTAAPA